MSDKAQKQKQKHGKNIFRQKKHNILQSLQRPSDSYQDASPKGSVDEPIRDLIDLINSSDDYVTTSSCSGRATVFVDSNSTNNSLPEPHRSSANSEVVSQLTPDSDNTETETTSVRSSQQSSGKGAGGRWLYVTHETVALSQIGGSSMSEVLGFPKDHGPSESRLSPQMWKQVSLIHFKFEPMILHIQAASAEAAQVMLTAALQAGFRESGITGLNSPCPMIAVRCQGLALDSVIGMAQQRSSAPNDAQLIYVLVVSEAYLEMMVAIANERFEKNAHRTTRFQNLIHALRQMPPEGSRLGAREDAQTRRMRKRTEGLQRQAALKKSSTETGQQHADDHVMGAAVDVGFECE